MLGDIIKMLADEPEKIEKAILRGIKLLLNTLIAAQLYRWILGSYTIIQLNNYSEWINFLLSGRVLLCLLFYLISDYLITPVIAFIADGLAMLVSKRKVISWPDDFKKTLKLFNVVDYSIPGEIPSPGKNIDVLYNLSKAFEEDDARQEIDSLKNTYIGNVLNLYSTFFLIYFLLLDSGLRTTALNVIIVTLLVFILFAYAIIQGIIDYMAEHCQEIISDLSFIKTNAVVMSMLGSHSIFPIWGTKANNLHKYKYFELKSKEYVIVPGLRKGPFRPGDLETFMKKRRKQGRIFILVIEQGLIPDPQQLMLLFTEELILVEFANERDLRQQLEHTIESIKPGSYS